MRVSVFGLGYVGSVSAANFAADGHDVVGVDVNPEKVAAVNAGRSPIVEPGLDELLKQRCRRPSSASHDQHRRGDRGHGSCPSCASGRRVEKTAASI
jgi:UDP-glucose 6-dehydrogenase